MWLKIHFQNPINLSVFPSLFFSDCKHSFSRLSDLSITLVSLLCSEGCLSWSLKGSGEGWQVFPKLSANPYYEVIPLMLQVFSTHTKIHIISHSNTLKSVSAEAFFFLVESLRLRDCSQDAEILQTAWDAGRPTSYKTLPCSAVTPSLCFPLLLLVFYQPLTRGCRQQSWQRVCVECTEAIYGHTLIVNKDCGARAAYCMCKLFLSLTHLMWIEAEHTLEALKNGALDILRIARTYKGMKTYSKYSLQYTLNRTHRA